jgi:hypothetical protein
MRWLSGRSGPAICVGVIFLYGAAGFPAMAQMKSAAAGIMLRAVLEQSLRVLPTPGAVMANAFVQSGETAKVPVTFTASWVRGPGSVSIAVFSGKFEDGFNAAEPFAVMPAGASPRLASGMPGMEIGPGMIPSDGGKNEVLTIRAQVI